MRVPTTLAALMVVLLLSTMLPVGHTIAASDDPAGLVAVLQAASGDELRIGYHARTGQVRFLAGAPGRPLPLPAGALTHSPEARARSFLRAYGSLFGLADPDAELRLLREQLVADGRSVLRFQQVAGTVPVIAGELNIQLDAGGQVLALNGEILPAAPATLTPTLDAATAAIRAREAVARTYGVPLETLYTSEPALWLYSPALLGPGTGLTRLVWRLEVTADGSQPVSELVLVDAERGSIALQISQIHTARQRQTHTANNGTTLPGILVCNESNPTCSGGDAHAAAAHRYAGDTYTFYANTHGRDSIDGAGMAIVSTVHYDTGYGNAYWDGTRNQMVYGDGYDFALADDVVAHELTHGVTNYESNLFYYYQSGAINESLSDIWGEFVDLTNGAGNDSAGVRWLMGEDVGGLGALRSMANPPAYGDPDRMTSPLYVTNANDNGGVHSNSGINNKAAYLLTDGGSFNGQNVTALGITKVAKIYYEAQTNLLVSGSDYADLYDLLYQACLNLQGTAGITLADCQEVRDATSAVEMNQQPVSGYNTDAALCPGGQNPTNLFYDTLEQGLGNWSLGAISGTGRWRYDSPYGSFAHSGQHSLYADDYPAQTSDSFAAMNTSVTLPAGALLHFAHAYGFEANYDGGVLEYSVNAGQSWIDAGSLFEVNGYDGTILGSSNPLGGRQGFLSDSHGYISSRLNLSSLAGQSVRFRWRMGLDSSDYDWGWWLDDVRIYTCGGAAVSPPQISSFTPTSGPVGTSVTILGQHFTGATSVTFGGASAVFSVVNAGQISATVPPGAASGPIVVTTPGGSAAGAAVFSVTSAVSPPQVSSFTPTSGPVGTSVTILGQHFTGATSVTFGGASAVFSVVNAGQISATVPPGAASGPIVVTTPGGSAAGAAVFSVSQAAGGVALYLPVLRNGQLPWQGVTQAGRPVSFVVDSSRTTVNNFKFQVVANLGGCQVTSTTTLSAPGGFPVRNDRFTINSSGGSSSVQISGVFTSPTVATGTYSISQTTACGAYSQSGTWSASAP